MYFIMECDLTPEGSGYMEIEDGGVMDSFEYWRIGCLEAAVPPDGVIVDVIPYEGYQGDPPELSDGNVPLMSDRLRRALIEAGVDNVVFHPVELRNTETGQRYPYHAFKIVGLVSATDLKKSEIASYDGDFIGDSSIRNLALDETKARGALIFRLAEKFSAIFVHEKVRKQIGSSAINTIKFIAPEDYYRL